MFEEIEMQARWMREEMNYSHAKTHGYAEKLRRLQLPQTDSQSVMAFMGSYWSRYQTFAAEFEQTKDSQVYQLALQQLAKLPTGLADKVGVFLWMKNPEQDSYVDDVVSLVEARSKKNNSTPLSLYGKVLTNPYFNTTLMGGRIEMLHRLVNAQFIDYAFGLDIAIENASFGMHVWRAYIDKLRKRGIEVQMPKPGVPSGQIEDWV